MFRNRYRTRFRFRSRCRLDQLTRSFYNLTGIRGCLLNVAANTKVVCVHTIVQKK